MEEIEIALAPFKVGDKVIVKGYEGMGEDEIICVFKTYDGDIKYKTKNHLNAHYFMEDSFTRVEKINKAEIMELTMKNKSKLINIEPKLVGNECVHFPIPIYMKLEVKDGMCYLYRDCGEQCKREGVNLQRMERKLDEALAKETPESLNKWLDEELEPEPKAPILSNRYDYAEGKCGYVIPDGYEFDSIKQGFQTEIIIRPIKPQYPKTYEECCQHLGCDDKLNVGELIPFQQLVNARNAYWKIAGKEMGLDKPWKPDWDNLSTTHEFIKINKGCFTYSSRVLVFPTEEMRDAFCENFKDLIEQCKELL